jgi:hypothetical protein
MTLSITLSNFRQNCQRKQWILQFFAIPAFAVHGIDISIEVVQPFIKQTSQRQSFSTWDTKSQKVAGAADTTDKHSPHCHI